MTTGSIRRSPALILMLALFLGLGWAAAGRAADGPSVTVSDNVQVNDPQKLFPADFPSRNTASLAASDDLLELLVSWDDFQGFCGPPTNRACPAPNPPGLTGYGFSTDGGRTWTDGGAPSPIGNAQTAGHGWVDRGGQGRFETFYLASRMRITAPDTAGVGIYRGHFGAGTFVWDDSVLINSPNGSNDYYSRPAIAAGKAGRESAAYVAIVNADEICGIPQAGLGRIEVWRTHDGGDTWQGPVVLAPEAIDISDPDNPDCGITGYIQTASVPAIGPNGEVYVAWQYGPYFTDLTNTTATSRIAFARSFDGGRTFGPPQFLVTTNNMRENPPVGYAKNRMNDQPRIAVAQSGPHRGRVYVAFYQSVKEVSGAATAQSNVSSQIYLTYSDNRGRTWSTPAPIGSPVPETGVKRFWPTPAVRPNGDVDIVYLESRETQVTADPTDVECSVPVGGGAFRKGPLSSLVDTWWIQSRDGGATFGAPVKVSSETSNWCTVAYTPSGTLYSNFGDYIGVVSGGHRTLTAWPDGRNGFSDVFFAEVKGTSKP